MNSCKGVCKRYSITAKKYEADVRRCTKCEVFFKTLELRCPCCKVRLRINSRWNKVIKRKNEHLYEARY